MTKHSRQRDAIYECLCTRFDHPTAEDIYMSLKPRMPDISLATVYRNLSVLESKGKLRRINADGVAHYDGNVKAHMHFTCMQCGEISDIMLDCPELMASACKVFDGEICDQSVLFAGYCADCASKRKAAEKNDEDV